MTYVHIFSVTFPGSGISQLRAVKTDLIVGSGSVKDKKNPAAAAAEEQAARPSESFGFFFLLSILLFSSFDHS